MSAMWLLGLLSVGLFAVVLDSPGETNEDIDPIDPADPVDPVDPTDPVDPLDPVDPVDPVDPIDPVDPVEEREIINGTEGADTLAATDNVIINGLGGNDELNATGGNAEAELNGGAGDDSINIRGGGGIGNGGAGNDTLSGSDGASLFGDAGDDRLSGTAGVDSETELDGGAGNDLLTVDLFTSPDVDNTISADGGEGDDLLEVLVTAQDTQPAPVVFLTGGAGADIFEIDLIPNPQSGGPVPATDTGFVAQITDFEQGTDQLVVPSVIQQFNLEGSTSDAVYYLDDVTFTATEDGTGTDIGLSYSDTENGGPAQTATIRVIGSNSLSISDISVVDETQIAAPDEGAINLVQGSEEADSASVAGNTGILTGAGDDVVSASGAGSFGSLGDGNDTLNADEGSGVFFGGEGNDSFTAGTVELTLHGGNGDDSVSVTGGTVEAYGNAGNDTFVSTATAVGGSTFYGGAGNDLFTLVAGDSAFGSANTEGSLDTSDSEVVVINTGAAALTAGPATFDDLGLAGNVTVNIAADLPGEVSVTSEAAQVQGPRGQVYDVTRTDVLVGETVVASINVYQPELVLSVENGNLIINRAIA